MLVKINKETLSINVSVLVNKCLTDTKIKQVSILTFDPSDLKGLEFIKSQGIIIVYQDSQIKKLAKLLDSELTSNQTTQIIEKFAAVKNAITALNAVLGLFGIKASLSLKSKKGKSLLLSEGDL